MLLKHISFPVFPLDLSHEKDISPVPYQFVQLVFTHVYAWDLTSTSGRYHSITYCKRLGD